MTINNLPMNTRGRKTKEDITKAVLHAVADPSVRVILITGRGRRLSPVRTSKR